MNGFGGLAKRMLSVGRRSGWLVLSAVATIPAMASGVPEVGFPVEAPGPGPFTFPSAEQSSVKVEIVARGLVNVFSLAFLPNGDALIVERGQRLRLLRHATGPNPELVPQPVANAPEYSKAEHLNPLDMMGIQDVKPDPDFAKNRLVYFTYNRPDGYDPVEKRIKGVTVLARARLDDLRLTDIKDLMVGESLIGPGSSRIMIGNDRHIYMSVGALSERDIESSQRTDNIYGKVLRVGFDGSIPADNPFVGVKGARPEIWTYGHRDALGLAIDPQTGRIVASEHGPQGGDELNVLIPGKNYGWPNYTYGTQYGGSPLPSAPVGAGTQGPFLIWAPGIAPNGITFYTGAAMPGWSNNLFVASARRGQINGTGAIIRVVFNDRLEEMRQEVLLDGLHQRFKDVRQGPDGLLYAVTDEENAIVVRIGPGADASQGTAAARDAVHQ
ncbi:PQQ-dependent sugar dehydrogenase [Novosphingobium sp. KN65.2]|uniref:PQQ-dependent sugar dehydrogenase n=1 Tax=Novosphingobium sp. KN65.2 TaxID=1478134 RepID=UPI0005E28931|nr:PQQ-dependent sugar dehydrogenase [Novosphingobium sp. KN65.2]CDO35323.1 Glucose sorbosone dehydrogenase [Novosphingobium sp. KN65.2]